MKLKKLFKRIKKLVKENNYKIKTANEKPNPGKYLWLYPTKAAGLNIKVKLRKK